MKDWIQDVHGEKRSYDELRDAVQNSMQARCEAVIRANGMRTEYSLFTHVI